MPYSVDVARKPGVLCLTLTGRLELEEMREFVSAHNAAVDGFRGRDYRVFCDLRALAPLSPEATAEFERAKAYSAARPNFRGSAVLVTSSIVSLQHQRTSVTSGVMNTELITDDEARCWDHLGKVQRVAR
ncbi:MAG: hypothetical protein K1X94_27465 [Sandaracinaceae bacterium]|nr:hypothetical protein [Sandaracinaceae bacterium]